MAAANALIAAGTLVLSSGGLVQGAIGHDEAFTLSLALGITVIYAGFVLAGSEREARRATTAEITDGGADPGTSSHGPSRSTNCARAAPRISASNTTIAIVVPGLIVVHLVPAAPSRPFRRPPARA